jgi:hypothetical protein
VKSCFEGEMKRLTFSCTIIWFASLSLAMTVG